VNASRFAIGLIVAALAGLWYFVGGVEPLSRISAAVTHENLSVYFIHGRDEVPDAKVLSLQEALDREVAVVHETSNWQVLKVENLSPEYELFIQSGDIVKGGQQDRMAATDMLLPPKSGVVPFPVHCVEQGRSSRRGTEDASRFASSAQCAAGKDLKYANATFQQSAVWHNVNTNQMKLNENLKASVNADASPTSFQLSLESPALKARIAAYEAALKARGEASDRIIGVVFVVNGQVTGAEVYGSNALFRKAWPKLLNAAAVEAVAEYSDAPAAPPPVREIENYLASGANPEPPGATGEPGAAAQTGRPAQLNIRYASALMDGDVGMVGGAQQRAPYSTEQPVFRGYDGVPNAQGPDRTRQIIEGNTVSQERVLLNQLDLRPGAVVNSARTGNIAPNPSGAAPTTVVDPTPVPPPVNPVSNRLSSNRVENSSTLLVESRDPARKNAVIHKSYIRK
jgi:hypothetical protein